MGIVKRIKCKLSNLWWRFPPVRKRRNARYAMEYTAKRAKFDCPICGKPKMDCMCTEKPKYLDIIEDPLKHTIVDLEMEQIVKELASE